MGWNLGQKGGAGRTITTAWPGPLECFSEGRIIIRLNNGGVEGRLIFRE